MLSEVQEEAEAIKSVQEEPYPVESEKQVSELLNDFDLEEEEEEAFDVNKSVSEPA